VRSRFGVARVQQLLAQLCEKAGLGGKAERYRQQAVSEMRSLGDRRATAELLLTDMPAKAAVVIRPRSVEPLPSRDLGRNEVRERSKRKSQPPP
jgi:hypothetical protein